MVVSLAGCGAVPWHRDDGRIEATWSGAERGRVSAPAAAVWCSPERTAQLSAVRGDTGLGFLIHAAESLAVGRYPIVEPAEARAKAPAASVGLRLITQTAVSGYQSRAGTLVLERIEPGRISGRFDATGRSATGAVGTISLSGRFVAVPLTTAGAECAR
jgi:hypothetical protein